MLTEKKWISFSRNYFERLIRSLLKLEKPDLKDLALTMKLKVEELREQAQNLE